jgi:hypothetical protein
MSDHKKEAKAASAAKMQRMGLKLEDGSKSFTDERGGSPFEGLNSGNAGKMPITPSRFKRGGKVSKHANLEGAKAKHNLGKAPRKAAGGSSNVPLPPPRPKDKIPLPPRRSVADEYEAYHPNEDTDLGSKGSSYARGGLSNMNPMKRKAAIGAMVARKNKMGMPSAPPASRGILPLAPAMGSVPMRKSGGAAKHTDEAQDKKLMHKILKEKVFKADGGGLYANIHAKQQRIAHGSKEHMRKPGSKGAPTADAFVQSAKTAKTNKATGGKAMHHEDCSCKMCSGGMATRSKKMDGGSLTNANPMMQRPGMGQAPMGQGPFNPMGNRPMRASGGRTKAGKTNVNIIISPQSGQTGPLGAGVGMGQPPVPPMMPPAGGMPPGGMPPMMPPAPPMGGAPGGGLPPQLMAALAGRGGMPPMARKSGGRVGNVMPKYQEKDYGSGSGLGRLEKKKWPTANGTE